MVHFLLKRIQRDIYFAGSVFLLGAELRAISEDRAGALVVFGGDVHDKRGTHLRVNRGVKNLEGAEGFPLDAQLLDAREGARVIPKRRGVVVGPVKRLP